MDSRYSVRAALFISLAIVFVLSATFAGSAEKKEYELKAISAWPKTVFEVQNFMKFLDIVKENVKKEYPGELTIKYVGGPEVIPNREQVEALRNGLVDMVFTTSGYYVSVLPVVDGLNLSHMKPWEERAAGVNDFLNAIHQEKANAYYLGRLGLDLPFTLFLTKPIESANLTGMKIRCSPTHIAFLKALGAQPLVIPPPDVYTALERGLADGYMWPAGLIRDWGWNEVTKYMVDPSVYNGVNVVLINLHSWKKLPERLQKLLIKSEEEAEQYAVERAQKHMADEVAAYQKEGIKVIKLSPEEAEKFTKAANDSLWAVVIEKAPENGPKLKELLSK